MPKFRLRRNQLQDFNRPATSSQALHGYASGLMFLVSIHRRIQVTVFESQDADGLQLDLLDLRDEELLLTVDSAVPAGEYSGVRLQINKVEADGI